MHLSAASKKRVFYVCRCACFFIKFLHASFAFPYVAALAACSVASKDITTSASGDVLTDMKMRGSGRAAPFDGSVDSKADLNDLLLARQSDASSDLQYTLMHQHCVSHHDQQDHYFLVSKNFNQIVERRILWVHPKVAAYTREHNQSSRPVTETDLPSRVPQDSDSQAPQSHRSSGKTPSLIADTRNTIY